MKIRFLSYKHIIKCRYYKADLTFFFIDFQEIIQKHATKYKTTLKAKHKITLHSSELVDFLRCVKISIVIDNWYRNFVIL